MSVQHIEGRTALLDAKWEIADDQIREADKLFRRRALAGLSFHLPDNGRVGLVIFRRPEGEVLTTTYEHNDFDIGEGSELRQFRVARKLTVSPAAGRLLVAEKDYDLRAETLLRRQMYHLSEVDSTEVPQGVTVDTTAEQERLNNLLAGQVNARYADLPQPEIDPDPIRQCELAAELQSILHMTLEAASA